MGVEPTIELSEKNAVLQTGAPKCAPFGPDSDLTRLVTAWPTLTNDVRAAILRLADGGE